jgi:peroxiredoxin Q/BCP
MKLKINDKAPRFELPDQKGIIHNISQYLGQWLLLYFYPRDNTPGCTKEACSFRDHFLKLKEKLEIVGVSGDSVESHKRFSDKYTLPFTILSDKKRKTIKNYGANGLIFAKRTSFLIDPKGVIIKIYEKVDPSIHATEILKDISQFAK